MDVYFAGAAKPKRGELPVKALCSLIPTRMVAPNLDVSFAEIALVKRGELPVKALCSKKTISLVSVGPQKRDVSSPEGALVTLKESPAKALKDLTIHNQNNIMTLVRFLQGFAV